MQVLYVVSSTISSCKSLESLIILFIISNNGSKFLKSSFLIDYLLLFHLQNHFYSYQDKKFVSDFDRFLLGTENINKKKHKNSCNPYNIVKGRVPPFTYSSKIKIIL